VRKKRAVVVVILLLVLVTGLWFLTKPRPHQINQVGFDQITEGMTQQEVEEVLGGPPGDYTDRRWVLLVSYDNPMFFRALARREDWLSDDGSVCVAFDEGSRVVEKKFYAADDCLERPWKDRVLRALHRSLPSSVRAYFP
jgi:hypothetical protein